MSADGSEAPLDPATAVRAAERAVLAAVAVLRASFAMLPPEGQARALRNATIGEDLRQLFALEQLRERRAQVLTALLRARDGDRPDPPSA